jgi:hypothetical protein
VNGYTCITEVRDSTHLTQHTAATPAAALREHVSTYPYDDAAGPFDDELDWLLRVSGGTEPVELLPVGHCPGVWFWRDGARREPPYTTYVVQTDVPAGW